MKLVLKKTLHVNRQSDIEVQLSGYQFRWSALCDNPEATEGLLAWHTVETRQPWQSMADRIGELESCTYGGKPIYEVRSVYTSVPEEALS